MSRGIPNHTKVVLLWRVWTTFAAVQLTTRRYGLPEASVRLGTADGSRPQPVELLSRAVSRGLRIGPWQPRCLARSLVLYRLLHAQGEPAELVVGLPGDARTWDAHAWVELRGRDVGPLPGSRGHQELVRFGKSRVSPRHAGDSVQEAAPTSQSGIPSS